MTARWSPMRRTCRCISARWTARSRPSSATTRARSAPATSTPSTRPITAARICPTSPCARRCSTTGRRDPVLGRLARPPRRCRRHLAGLDVAQRHHHRAGRRLYRQFQAGRSRPLPREGMLAALTGAKYPARNPVQNVNDLKAQIAANEKGVAELRKMVTQFTLPVVKAYMQHVQDNAAESVRRVIDRLHDSEFSYEMDQGTVIKVKITVDKKKREADRRFHRHLAAAADQFQRARAGDARRRALRVPRDGRRRHPDECRLPAADQHRDPEEVDAVAGISGRRRRRQCRDLAGGDQLPVRRARRARRGAGHDEQPQFRQRDLSVLRDDLLRLAGRSRLSTAPMPCTRT